MSLSPLFTDCVPDEIQHLSVRDSIYFCLHDGFIWLEEKGWWEGFKDRGAALWGRGRKDWGRCFQAGRRCRLAVRYQETAGGADGGLCCQEQEVEGWGRTAGWARQVRDGVESRHVPVLAVQSSCLWHPAVAGTWESFIRIDMQLRFFLIIIIIIIRNGWVQ